MATRSIIVIVDIEDDGDVHVPMPSDRDLAEGIVARLDEFYPTDEVTAVPSNHRVAVASPEAVTTLLGAAGVGLDGAPDEEEYADEAWAAAQALAATFE